MRTLKVSDHDFKQLKRLQELYDSDPLIKALIDAWDGKNEETKKLRADLEEAVALVNWIKKMVHGDLMDAGLTGDQSAAILKPVDDWIAKMDAHFR